MLPSLFYCHIYLNIWGCPTFPDWVITKYMDTFVTVCCYPCHRSPLLSLCGRFVVSGTAAAPVKLTSWNRMYESNCSWISTISRKWWSCSCNFVLRNKQILQGAKSGRYEWWEITAMLLTAKNCCTQQCALAHSQWSKLFSFHHYLRCFQWMCSLTAKPPGSNDG